jgi:hypothetical protein
LSQIEIRAFERYPELQKHPNNILDGLATAVLSLENDLVSDRLPPPTLPS